MSVKLGVAPCSWGIWFPEDEKQTPWNRCLDEIQEAGYHAIELGPWGYLPNQYESLKEELEKRNIDLVATTLMDDLTSDENVAQMITQLDEMAALQTKFTTAKYVVLIDATYTDLFTGELLRPKELNDEEWKGFIRNINRIKDHAKEKYGLETVYHPHGETHVETDEQIERLLQDTDIQLCFDTGHHVYSGGDALEFIKKHHARISYLHIKNCDAQVKAQKQQANWSLAEAVQENIFCEPDQGVVNVKEVMEVLTEVNFDGWAIVEQDMYPAPFDQPLPIAKRTREYLESVGMVHHIHQKI